MRPLSTLTAAPKLWFLSTVMSFEAPAESVVAPATEITPESVMAPSATTERPPSIVEAPRIRPCAVLSVTLRPLDTRTAPSNALPAESRVMS